MSLPVVAIIGRPNVGKSSLLNLLARQRISIVDPRPGITRDCVSTVIEHGDCYFELVDTGGVGIVDADHLEAHVEGQIRYAIERASLILFIVDTSTGLAALDQRVADLLRPLNKPTIVVANKTDEPRHEAEAAAFHALGFQPVVYASAAHGRGREELLAAIVEHIGDEAGDAPAAPVMKLALVGKRNAGKSTLVNVLAGEPRMIVSEVPGTTRDAVDVQFERDGRVFVAIDTAGVRKKARMQDVDFYSYTRALRSIRRADVVMLLIDATVPVAEPDVQLAGAILDEFKPVLIAVNKWDLAKNRATSGDYGEYLTQVLPALRWAPIVFVTSTTGQNVDAAVDTALALHTQNHTRIATAPLNEALQTVLAERGPSAKRGTKAVKLYYATQVATAPPTIICFCNDPGAVTENYRRFLENRLRELLPFKEVPMRLWFRPRRAPREQRG